MSAFAVRKIGKGRFQVETNNTVYETRFYVSERGRKLRLLLSDADLLDLIEQI